MPSIKLFVLIYVLFLCLLFISPAVACGDFPRSGVLRNFFLASVELHFSGLNNELSKFWGYSNIFRVRDYVNKIAVIPRHFSYFRFFPVYH